MPRHVFEMLQRSDNEVSQQLALFEIYVTTGNVEGELFAEMEEYYRRRKIKCGFNYYVRTDKVKNRRSKKAYWGEGYLCGLQCTQPWLSGTLFPHGESCLRSACLARGRDSGGF